MRVGSLFSGYGGLDMAVGGELAWYSEIDPAACKVMEAHHPGVPNLGDITKVDWRDVPPVDVITGGYPCQPFSNAGERRGADDERHLWPHVRDALRTVRPRGAVLENVRGHLTLGFDIVLSDLADMGWSARWGLVRASEAGAPHQRSRIFILAYPDGGQPPRLAEHGGLQQSPEHDLESADAKGDFSDGRPLGHDELHAPAAGPNESPPGGNDLHVADAEGAERGAAEPDDLRPRGASEPGERPGVAADASGERHGSGEGPAGVGGLGSEPEGSGRQISAAWEEPGAGGAQSWGDYEPAIERWGSVIGRAAPAPTIQRAGRDRLNPVFVEWMMGLPEGWVTGHGLSGSQELKMLGNGVVPQQARLALKMLDAA